MKSRTGGFGDEVCRDAGLIVSLVVPAETVKKVQVRDMRDISTESRRSRRWGWSFRDTLRDDVLTGCFANFMPLC